jgi:hypothetical protein
MAGRPKGTFGTKRITKELTKNICDLIEIGMPPHYAAQEQGISERLFQIWMQLGRQAQEKDEWIKSYSDFFSEIARARARCIKRMLVRAHTGEKGSSTAMWVLEKQYREEFGSSKPDDGKQQIEIVVKNAIRERDSESECQQ